MLKATTAAAAEAGSTYRRIEGNPATLPLHTASTTMAAIPAARPTHGPRLSVPAIARSSSSAAAPASARSDQRDAVSTAAIANGSAMLRIAANGTGCPIVEPGRMLGQTNTSHPAD